MNRFRLIIIYQVFLLSLCLLVSGCTGHTFFSANKSTVPHTEISNTATTNFEQQLIEYLKTDITKGEEYNNESCIVKVDTPNRFDRIFVLPPCPHPQRI